MRLRATLVLGFAFLASTPAFAAFHEIKVKEVFAGSAAHPNAQYVLLQAYNGFQNSVDGHSVLTFDALGAPTGTFTFTDNVGNPANQMTIFVATPEAATMFNITADLAMTAVLTAAGGKVCWEGSTPDDCVAWGNYTGSLTGVGTSAGVPVGIEPGQALRRRLDIAGNPTLLEDADDTNDSANDFLPGTPAPRTNMGVLGTIPPSTCGNSAIESLEQCDDGNAAGSDGCSAVCDFEPDSVAALELIVDELAALLANNSVLEPGETVEVRPTWQNNGLSAITLSGAAAFFTGPAGATYGIVDGTANYGSLSPDGDSINCVILGDCYMVSVSAPATRPVLHWDATFTEVVSNTAFKDWSVHVGESFPDVPTSHPFYPFVENLFHNGVTGGCAGGNYCPGDPVTRAQMAVFLLKAKLGSGHVPPACTGTVFADVPCTGGAFDPWIEELSGLGITGGCGGGLYCPAATVTRQQMAVFLLKAHDGSSFDPPDCAGDFDDVPCTPGTGFADWIEVLFARGITGGCQVSPPLYCPTNPNNRGQMAVFLVKTFSLVLYGQ